MSLKNYIIYDKLSGDIIKNVSCGENIITLQISSNQLFIEHDKVDDNVYKINLDTKIPIIK
jgi:hypothetical protein